MGDNPFVYLPVALYLLVYQPNILAMVPLKKQTTAPSMASTPATMGPAESFQLSASNNSLAPSGKPMGIKATVQKRKTAPTTKQAVVMIFVRKPFLKSKASTPPISGRANPRKIMMLKLRTVVSPPSKPSVL